MGFLLLTATATSWWLSGVSASSGNEAARGVVVEQVLRLPGVDLRPGDRLTGWRRGATSTNNPPAQGTIDSPFSLRAVEINESPRGTLILQATRAGVPFEVSAQPGEWTIVSRPDFSGELLTVYEEGRRLEKQGKAQDAANAWRRAAEQAAETDPAVAPWLGLTAAQTLNEAGAWEPARAILEDVVDRARGHDDTIVTSHLLEAMATGMEAHGQLAEAERVLSEALEQRRPIPGGSLLVAETLYRLGNVYRFRGDLPRSKQMYEDALALQEKDARDSSAMAATVVGFALLGPGYVDARWTERFSRAKAIEERLAAPGHTLAEVWTVLGSQALTRGDLDQARTFWAQALALDEAQQPESIEFARDLHNCAVEASFRGDVAGGDAMFRHALRILERLSQGSLRHATTILALGQLAESRDDFDDADQLYLRALRLKAVEGTFSGYGALLGRGHVAVSRGDWAAAGASFSKARTLWEKLAPGYEDWQMLTSLADLAQARGENGEARTLAAQAAGVAQQRGPTGYPAAHTLTLVGDYAIAGGDFDAAEDAYRKALEIENQLLPGSDLTARTYYGLARIQRRRHDVAASTASFTRALDALEMQLGRIGGADDVKAAYGADHQDMYRDAVAALVEEGRPDEAFRVVERSRAQLLRTMLAERDLVFSAEIPAELDRERRRIDGEYDLVQAQLFAQNDAKAAAGLLERVRELRDARNDVIDRVRAASPRLAALQYPKPLDVQGVRAELDPGTVMLSYSVGIQGTVLFALEADAGADRPPAAFRIAAGRAELGSRVKHLRELMQHPEAERADVGRAAAELYRALVQPAESVLEKAQRILICPDGPLQALPWAALIHGSHYLVEWKPLHVVVSGTVYAELRKLRRSSTEAAPRVVAFGDPRYPRFSKSAADAIPSPEVRREVMRGRSLEPLPATRREVESLGRIFGNRLSKYLGDEATEEHAKALGKDVRYVHFACHAFVDERFPLDSALALSMPEHPSEGQENGLLQAWEIFERVRLDADLVTLSACNTGLGAERGGEGLLGLTRAFQYAGARTVLASLWSVPDRSTAELMRRFYGFLRAGHTKDAALRRAQLAMIRGGGLNARPLRWAAFQLTGDWQ
jgi:CHAT domain-containing protein/Tfp pilus assembly protein PilF